MTDYRLSEYDKKRQQELNSANLAPFWFVFIAVGIAVTIYLFFASGG